MLRPCRQCGYIPRKFTKHGLLHTTYYIECPRCGKRTSDHTAIWASDAANQAEWEWIYINK